MNWKHFVALVKLRYQLSRNQVKKAGKLNAVLSMIFLAFGVLCSVSSFLVGAIGGAFWFQSASPNTIFVTWNVIVIAFLAIWTIGVLMELQQTELMSIDKLLHLPVSLQGAFFLNYTSSFINSAFLLFVPMMIGVSIGMSIARGPTMLIAIPLVVGFLFMVTTLTYQLQGWLSRLMENKRTRGTVIVVVTISFILLTQVPNLVSSTINESSSDKRKRRNAEREVLQEKAREEVLASIVAGEATEEEKPGLMEAAAAVAKKAYAANRKKERAAKFASIVDFVKKLDVYAPPGWLPLGILRAAERKWTTGVVGSLAMFAIGFISLTFSYRSSMRRYLGVGAKPRKRKPVDGSELLKESESLKGAAEFMFRRIPFVNENVSAVAVAGFRGLMRAPETKMIMVFPFIMGMLACSFLVGKSDFNIPELLRPWIPIGV
ncbi:MAG: ABC-2 type transport system permease protein, partial [Mariniblastus sp.]